MKTEVRFYCRRVTQELTLWLVGTIGPKTDPPTSTRSNSPLGIISPTPAFTHSDVQNEATNGVPLLGSRPPSRPEYPPQSLASGIQEVTTDTSGIIFEFNALAYDNPTLDRSHTEGQLLSAILDHMHNPHDNEVTRFSDSWVGDGEATRPQVGSPPVEARFWSADIMRRAMTRLALPKRVYCKPREETVIWVSTVPISPTQKGNVTAIALGDSPYSFQGRRV